jgi:hypothetical protein
MPVCQSCNNSYDANFKFCPHCGKTNSDPEPIIYHVTSDDIWESCETNIVVMPYDKKKGKMSFLGTGGVMDLKWVFEATAIGTNGVYSAGQSEILKGPGYWDLKPEEKNDYHYLTFDASKEIPSVSLHRDTAQEKLNALIKKLTSEGWQSVGQGKKWWNERFRRKVNPSK